MTPEPDPTMAAADRQILIIGAGIFLILALLAFIPDVSPSGAHGLVSERAHARIESITPATDQSPPLAVIVFVDGSRAGQRTEAQVEGPSGQLQLPDYQAGDEVIVALDTDPDGNQATSVIDRWRLPVLEYLVGAFAIVTIIVAGWRGIRALVSLALTLVLAVKLLIPLLLAGWNPVGLAISLGTLITIASLLLTQGFTRATLELAGDRLDLSGLLLAAVIFGGLGVLNDVAISQAATVEELHAVSPSMSRRELFTRTMNVGIAHLAATVNTLVFAYLGAALPLLVLLALQIESVGLSVNEEIVAVEVVRTIVGSIGILLAVPITTAIACWLAVRSTEA